MGAVEAVLAIDPGAVSGWALLTVGPSPQPVLTGTLHVTKPAKHQPETPSALVRLVAEEAAVRCITIVRAVIEDQYLDKNPDTLKKLARSAGRWEEALVAAGLPVEYLAASAWQSRELGMRGARREVLRRAADAKAFGMWQLEGPEHLIDAALIARCVAVTMYASARCPAP